MRLLLIAYEFPPSPSPQSLRWTYLARELDLLGHEVHVLTADLGGETPGLPALPASIRVHRTYPGPVRGMLAYFRKRRQRKIEARPVSIRDGAQDAGGIETVIRPPRNWKQRASEGIQTVAQYVHFPDIRGEWRPWGRRALHRLLTSVNPDVVISSHEPATTIELALQAKRRGFPWIADLGDPVLASYTPARWRRRSEKLESAMCREADLLTMTTDATVDLMQKRYARERGFLVLPQGHDPRRTPGASTGVPFQHDRLELLYTGSFYLFRRPDALLAGLLAVPEARLTIAAITVPESVLEAARRSPSQIRLLGFRPHGAILDLQRSADLLVNIANDDMTQIPGKVNEYLGAGRPLLNLGPGNDPVSRVITHLKRGWNCTNEADAIADCLRRRLADKSAQKLDMALDLSPGLVDDVSWPAIAARLDTALTRITTDNRTRINSG
jgi:glycosyltransferase involved in cell wall biosynthesis